LTAGRRQFGEWLGVDDFDMAAFDLDDMNFRLKKDTAHVQALL
jgi:hypothetical protein